MTITHPHDTDHDIALADALSALSNEVRIAILQVFFEETTPGTIEPEFTLTFSELCERVDVASSSQFAYHLEQLTDQFLHKTDDGYALTYAGVRLLRALHAGSFTESISRKPLPIAEPCPKCNQTSLEARCEGNYVEIYCTAHKSQVGLLPFPPTGLRRDDPQAFLRALNRYHRFQFALAVDGICPECGGAIESEFQRRDKQTDGREAALRLSCGTCGWWRGIPALFCVLEHPAVVGFYAEHGENIRDRPVWSLGENWDEQVVAEEQVCIEVRTQLNGEELRLVVDDDLTVQEIERSVRNYEGLVEESDESSN